MDIIEEYPQQPDNLFNQQNSARELEQAKITKNL